MTTRYSTLVSTDVVAAQIGDPYWVTVDCRFELRDPGWGEREYRTSHLPGAVYAHLDRDLSGRPTGRNGRHPLPEVHELTATLGSWGIAAGVQVVAYDQSSGMYASRLWWLLRYLGHDAVAVLDGGLAKWQREGRPVEPGVVQREPRAFLAAPRPHMLTGVDEVEQLVASRESRLVDARARPRYRGEVEPLDRVPGHIPGAVNHFYEQNLSADGTFLPAGALRPALAWLAPGGRADRLICYCGSGVSACHNLLALEIAGLTGARLYPGSYSEWSADPDRAIETGDDAPAD